MVYAPLGGPIGVAVDAAGAVYIADRTNGSISKVSDGVVTTIYYNDLRFSNGDPFITGLALDAAGNVYISGSGVLKVTPNGIVSSVVVVPGGSTTGVAVDTAGNIYFAEPFGGTVMKVTPQGVVSTLVGGILLGGFLLGSPHYEAGSVAIDAAGNLYTAGFGVYSIRKLSAGGVLSTIAGNGTPSFYGDGAPATDALFSYTEGVGTAGVALDAAGSLYVADTFNYRVRKITTDGTITTVAGNGGTEWPFYAGDGGQAADADVYPFAIAVDIVGILYIAEGYDIRKVRLDGIISSFQYIPATNLAFGPYGSLYASSDIGIVDQILPTGWVVRVAGNGWFPGCEPALCSMTLPSLGDGGPATQATIFAAGIAVDSASNLYIADTQDRIREVVNSTGVITTIAGSGSIGYSGDGGPATDAQLNSPMSVALDAAGNLYIADTGNYVVRKVSTDGVITTIAGNGSQGHSGDGGPALEGQFLGPVSLAIDADGNIYVSDGDSIRLLKPVTQCVPAAPASTSRR